MKAIPSDILETIVARRKADIAVLGFELGCAVPKTRNRKIVPFLEKRGVILEIKRASPSKGDIAPSLDAVKTALTYAASGAGVISVLTEMHWFKGSLNDLIAVSAALGNTAVLRKDFLLEPEEIDVAYRCGADAVLLIARILTKEKLLKMAGRCAVLGISALVEVRLASDVEKFRESLQQFPKTVIAGVNSRDLSNFTVDALQPAKYLTVLNSRVVYESGVLTQEKAALVSSMGFHGMLLGEAAARNPEKASSLVSAFLSTGLSPSGRFWIKTAEIINKNKIMSDCKPLIKICGLTQKRDAVKAAKLGAHFLGFICTRTSPRYVTGECIKDIVSTIKAEIPFENTLTKPLFIGVITDPFSKEAAAAFQLVKDEILDAIQFHNCRMPSPLDFCFTDIGRYEALKIGSFEDVKKMEQNVLSGCPRILLDASVAGKDGGTGCVIPENLVAAALKSVPLWLAGGINAENVVQIIQKFHPELIDISSGIESEPGKKDFVKMEKLFSLIKSCS